MANLLGQLTPDPFGQMLGTHYDRFASETGIRGLCRVEGRSLELLVVDAERRGTGQFREFIRRAKLEYDHVSVWEVWNVWFRSVLERYGFKPVSRSDRVTGEPLDGYEWGRA